MRQPLGLPHRSVNRCSLGCSCFWCSTECQHSPLSWHLGSAVRVGAQRLFTLLQAATAASTAQYVGFSAMLFMLVRQGRLDLRDLGSMPALAEVVPFAKVSASPLRLFGVAFAEGMASPAVQRPWFVTCGCCKCVPLGGTRWVGIQEGHCGLLVKVASRSRSRWCCRWQRQVTSSGQERAVPDVLAAAHAKLRCWHYATCLLQSVLCLGRIKPC